jgi:hypothetical protein
VAWALPTKKGVNRFFQQYRGTNQNGAACRAQYLRGDRGQAPHSLRAPAGSEAAMSPATLPVDTRTVVHSGGLWGPALRLILAVTLCLFFLATVCGAVIVK